MAVSKSQGVHTANDSVHARARYEQIKRRNFIGSSRLEGIELPEKRSNQTLDEIVAKYKAMSHG